MNPTFTGEMQLAGWSESHNGGCKVTFWLQSPDDLEAFRALTVRKGNTAGHRFMAALVEIGDDEQPVEEPEKVKGGPMSRLAGMWCAHPKFWEWVNSVPHEGVYWQTNNESSASEFVREICGVESRAEIDIRPTAAQRFNALIRKPYMDYREAV